jgi:hypothetical protein
LEGVEKTPLLTESLKTGKGKPLKGQSESCYQSSGQVVSGDRRACFGTRICPSLVYALCCRIGHVYVYPNPNDHRNGSGEVTVYLDQNPTDFPTVYHNIVRPLQACRYSEPGAQRFGDYDAHDQAQTFKRRQPGLKPPECRQG